jgi:flagellar biosynthesis chaperone FliJ
MVDGYRRYFLKASAVAGMSAFLGGAAGFLSGRQLAYEEFRQRFEGLMENIQELEQARKTLTEELSRARADSTRKDSIISEQQAKINQLSEDYRNALDVISLSDQLKAETVDALSLYNTIERQAIDKLYTLVAKYTEKLGGDRVKAEKKTADILSLALDQRTKLEETISEKQNEIEKLSKQLDDISKSGYTLFEANFSPNNFYGFRFAIDASVGCPQIPVTIEDGKMEIVKDETSPQEDGYCLQLISNVRKKPGLLMMGIAYRDVPFLENSRYIYSGFFRVVEEAQVVSVGLSRVENFEERFAEILWLYSREFGDTQGDVITRNPTTIVHGPNQWECVENCDPVRITNVKPDNDWHYFEIEAIYRYVDGSKERVLKRVQFDGYSKYVNLNMGRTKKSWRESFGVNYSSGNRAVDFKLCGDYITQDVTRFAKPSVTVKRI